MKNIKNSIKVKYSSQKAITLIALVITIIIMLILVAVAMNLLFGEKSIIDRSKEAKFKTHFADVQEKVNLYIANKETEAIYRGETLTINDKLPLSEKAEETEFSEHLKNEINQISGKEVSEVNLYYIDKTKIGTNQKHKYIIDIDTLQIYDVEGENFFRKWHHTLNGIDSENEDVPEDIIDDDPKITRDGDMGWYSPNMEGFNGTYTYLIYYNETDTTDTKEVAVKEYIQNGKKNKIQENGKTYVLDLYNQKMWANAKTTANGLECWWVWIPRYAYKINSTAQQMEIVFVDLNNNPIGTQEAYDTANDTTSDFNNFEEEYIVHPSFDITQEDGSIKKLQGIWVSKYEASNNTTHEMSSDICYEPDLTGFDKNYTYIELYDATTSTYTEEKCLSETNLSTINSNNKWYDYSNKIWANVKTTANNLECWWVWIPRYAYHISEGNQEVEIIFTDTNNKPMDKQQYGNNLPEGFTPHPAFSEGGKELKGIWVSKYEASNNTTHEMSSDLCYAPDLDGFDKNMTYIELYDTETSTFVEEKCIADTDINTVNNDNRWYDYSKKQWANVKTIANGLECWWVWIPRYAYHISEGNQETEIIFIDTNNTPIDKQMYGDKLPEGFTPHPSFDAGGKKLKGIWVSKYESSYVNDIETSTVMKQTADGTTFTNTVNDGHTHDALGYGTTLRYVTSSTHWCDAYTSGGTNCSNYGYYRYCSKCGVKLRYYWCEEHFDKTKEGRVAIDDSSIQ